MGTTFPEFIANGQRVIPRDPTETFYRQYNVPPYMSRDLAEKPTYAEHYLQETQRWCDLVYDSALTQISADEEIRNTRDYINYIMGQHWPSDRPAYRPKPVLNKIGKHFWDNVANLTDVRLNMDVRTNNSDLKEIAKTLTSVAQTNYRSQMGTLSLIFTAMHASLNVGFTKVAYNAEADDVTFVPCGSDAVVPILGHPLDIQQSQGVIYRAWKPLTWFGEKFPMRAHLIKGEPPSEMPYYGREKPGWIDDYSWNAYSSTFREFIMGAFQRDTQPGSSAYGASTAPVALYTEFWFKDPQLNSSKTTLKMGYGNWWYYVEPGKRLYPFGRFIATAQRSKRVILTDCPNMHWHGLFPFAMLKTQAVPWLWSGISEFRDLWPIQEPIDNVIADGLSMLKQAANKTMVTRDGSMADASWDNYFPGMSGAKLKLLNRSDPIATQVTWIGPDTGALGAVPALYGLLKAAFDEQSGAIDVHRMSGKKQMPSPDTISEMREQQQSKYRVKGIFLEYYFDQLGRLQVPDIIQFYRQKKLISMQGKGALHLDYFDYDPKTIVNWDQNLEPFRRGHEFVKKFMPTIQAGTALPAQRRESMQLALLLMMAGKMSMETFYSIAQASGANLPDAKQEMVRIVDEMKKLPQPAKKGRGGKTPQLPPPAQG
jgi:hypothetical protein